VRRGLRLGRGDGGVLPMAVLGLGLRLGECLVWGDGVLRMGRGQGVWVRGRVCLGRRERRGIVSLWRGEGWRGCVLRESERKRVDLGCVSDFRGPRREYEAHSGRDVVEFGVGWRDWAMENE
jgi:hypothetical protein